MDRLITLLAALEINPNDVDLPRGQVNSATIDNGLRLFFGVVGGIALIIIIISGLKYVLSQGNPQETVKAKDTILYAIIGLVVCILGFGIVGFVFKNL